MYLLGRFSDNGMWFFYPVTFFLKTPVALHLLLLLAIAGAWLSRKSDWRRLFASNLRMPIIGALVMALFLLSAKLTIGFRYALPALPLYQHLQVDVAPRRLAGVQPSPAGDALTWSARDWRFGPP